jgi:hypothetical protein
MTAHGPIHAFSREIYMLKQRAKHRKKPGGKTIAQLVANMAATGHVEDEIALHLGVDKNTLRARYIAHIKAGKRARASSEAEAIDLTRAEMCCASAILASFDSEWFDPAYGNDLWPGLAGDNAKTAADAYARWLRDGGRLITSGIGKNFGPERIAEFCKLKAEAEKLLKR